MNSTRTVGPSHCQSPISSQSLAQRAQGGRNGPLNLSTGRPSSLQTSEPQPKHTIFSAIGTPIVPVTPQQPRRSSEPGKLGSLRVPDRVARRPPAAGRRLRAGRRGAQLLDGAGRRGPRDPNLGSGSDSGLGLITASSVNRPRPVFTGIRARKSLGVVVRRVLRAGFDAMDREGEGHGGLKVGSRRSGQGSTPGGGPRPAARG